MKVRNFVFQGGSKTLIRVSAEGKHFLGKKFTGCVGITCNSLKPAVKHLTENYFFTVGKSRIDFHMENYSCPILGKPFFILLWKSIYHGTYFKQKKLKLDIFILQSDLYTTCVK